jgi:Fe-S-cluster-containing hydrogenase component 2
MIAISMVKDQAMVDNTLCVECKICVRVCPVKAPTEIL